MPKLGFTQANLPDFKVFIVYSKECELQNWRIKLGIHMVLGKYCTHLGWAKFTTEEVAPFRFTSLNWIHHISKEVDLEFELKWQEETFNEL